MARMGRPTDNPKPYTVAARLDQETKDILDAYCKQFNVNRMEAVRRGIRKLDLDITKQSDASLEKIHRPTLTKPTKA